MEDKLPFEIWLEILSYIPQRYHRTTIGVNRALFEHALDEIYREVELVHDDDYTLFTFTRLRNPGIAKRVHRLIINSTFLVNDAAAHVDLPIVAVSNFTGMSKKRFNWFNRSKQSSVVNEDQLYAPQTSDSDTLLYTAQQTIPYCLNMTELVIVTVHPRNYGLGSSESFQSFFQSLWQPGSIIPRIRKLTINASSYELSQLVSHMAPLSQHCTALDHLEMAIHPHHDSSRIHLFPWSTFLDGVKNTLQSLTLSGPMNPYITQVLVACPIFPKLLIFNLHSIFNNQNMQQLQNLNLFLRSHSNTLQNITLGPRFKTDSPLVSNYSYFHWLTVVGTGHPIGEMFSRISLPELKTLEIDYDDRWINGSIYRAVVFPDLGFVAPDLTTLSIAHADLSLDRVSDLLLLLPRQNGRCLLDSLSISVDILSPELLDILSSTLTTLSSLTLRLSRYVLRSDLEQYMFYKVIQGRKYPDWNLQKICIVSSSSCGVPHPNMQAMTAVARTLSTPPTLDVTYSCQCYLAYIGAQTQNRVSLS